MQPVCLVFPLQKNSERWRPLGGHPGKGRPPSQLKRWENWSRADFAICLCPVPETRNTPCTRNTQQPLSYSGVQHNGRNSKRVGDCGQEMCKTNQPTNTTGWANTQSLRFVVWQCRYVTRRVGWTQNLGVLTRGAHRGSGRRRRRRRLYAIVSSSAASLPAGVTAPWEATAVGEAVDDDANPGKSHCLPMAVRGIDAGSFSHRITDKKNGSIKGNPLRLITSSRNRVSSPATK